LAAPEVTLEVSQGTPLAAVPVAAAAKLRLCMRSHAAPEAAAEVAVS